MPGRDGFLQILPRPLEPLLKQLPLLAHLLANLPPGFRVFRDRFSSTISAGSPSTVLLPRSVRKEMMPLSR